MPKFRFEKFVNADKKKVFEIFSDFQKYQKNFVQIFPSVRMLSTRNDVSVVEEHMMLGGKELVMMTKHIVDEPHKHEVFVIGGDAKGTHILELFDEYEGGTKMIIDVDFKLKGGMKFSNLLGKNKVENDYSDIIDEFVKNLEI